jgi:hypothetical protein
MSNNETTFSLNYSQVWNHGWEEGVRYAEVSRKLEIAELELKLKETEEKLNYFHGRYVEVADLCNLRSIEIENLKKQLNKFPKNP